MAELMFVAHNRLEFTQAAFAALLENTDWREVTKLHVIDDYSTDGTEAFLKSARKDVPVPCMLTRSKFGGPVAAMNFTIDRCQSDLLVKVDNDLIVCDGWLPALLNVIRSDDTLMALGFEPGFGEPAVAASEPRSWRPGPHIGGLGVMRTEIFREVRPLPNQRFFGWTEFQHRSGFQCGWITPDLPCFLLDHLPFEPWRSLAQEYLAKGWSRAWPAYPESMHAYWDWWAEAQEQACA